MAWYLRKSVSIGPIRFNISKSGIGTSVGIKGFRIGVKSNGRSYIHAGKYGLYYREEFDGAKQNVQTENQQVLDDIFDTTIFRTMNSTELISDSKKDFVNQLNQSYSAFRFDYLTGVISIIVIMLLCVININLMLGAILIGTVSTILVARWESRRRTININYEFENDNYSKYEQIILGFNYIAECKCIWSLLTSRKLYDTHESKLNAGASTIVDRLAVSAGKGNPPWVQANISIPVLKTTDRCLYFMPDGILVYDNKGVGLIEYTSLKITFDTTRFIEEFAPKDAEIVGTTWKYANVNGGPDRRFNNNSQLSICLYGELKIEAQDHLLLYIMTSKFDAPEKFDYSLSSIVINSGNTEIVGRAMPQNISFSNQDIEKKDFLNQYNLGSDVSNQVSLRKQLYQEQFEKVVVDSSDSWNSEMHNLLFNADILLENKKYEAAEVQYKKLLDFATSQNNCLYSSLVANRLKDLKNKIDLYTPCYPSAVFDIDMINAIIEDAKFYEAEKKYKKALSKYMEVRMYGIMYSSLPYINLAKVEIEKLKDIHIMD